MEDEENKIFADLDFTVDTTQVTAATATTGISSVVGTGKDLLYAGTGMYFPDVSISQTVSKKPTLDLVVAIKEIMDRLAILQPDFEKMEKYPALKEAYDNYKLIESMIEKDPNGNS